jgi:hypothetical protein
MFISGFFHTISNGRPIEEEGDSTKYSGCCWTLVWNLQGAEELLSVKRMIHWGFHGGVRRVWTGCSAADPANVAHWYMD